MDTLEALQIMFFLLPGLITYFILNALIVQKEKDQFKIFIESLIFSVFVYLTLSIFNMNQVVSFNSVLIFKKKALLLMISFTILYSIIFAFLINNDLILKCLRKIKVTKKTTRDSVWHDVFYNHKKLIILNFSDGRRMIGFPKHYSDHLDAIYVYLENPAWIIENEETGESDYRPIENCFGVLITPEQKISYIEFQKRP